MKVQTRSEENGLKFFASVKEAFDHANDDITVWKVSFNAEDGSRCRFVRVKDQIYGSDGFAFEPIELPSFPLEEDADETRGSG